jgi:hypothetical protein
MEHYDTIGLHLIVKDFDDAVPPTNIFRNALVCSFDEYDVSDDFMYRFRLKVMELKIPIVCIINRSKLGSKPVPMMMMADSAGILKGNVITMVKNRAGPNNQIVRI